MYYTDLEILGMLEWSANYDIIIMCVVNTPILAFDLYSYVPARRHNYVTTSILIISTHGGYTILMSPMNCV